MTELTDTDYAILAFEHGRYKYAGAKAAAIRNQLGLSETRYYARLAWLIEQPDAWEYAPALVRRLGRLQAARRAVRTG